MADLLESVNRVRYIGSDFNSHSDEILSRLQVKYGADFNDFAASSLGIMLVDLVAYGLDTLSFYLDRRATDTFLETARTRRSVARLTRQIGYKMRSAIASSVDVTLRILDAFFVPIIIPQGYQFQGPNNLIFEAAQSVTFNPGDGAKDIPCYEGETFDETFVSTGLANQVFELRRVPEDTWVVGGSVRVTVDGTPWVENEFLSFEQTNQYEIGYNDDPPTLRFGDGIAGNIPATGASVVITYITSHGRTGRVARNTITSTVVPLVVMFQTLQTSVNNAAGAVGGEDPESVDEAKRNAPKVFKTRQVAVTREDYESLGNAYADPLAGRVAVAQAISSRSADDDLFLKDRINTIKDAFQDLPVQVGAEIGSPKVVGAGSAAWQFLLDAQTELSTLGTNLTSAAAASSSATTQLTNAQTSGRTVKNTGQDIQANATDTISRAATLQGLINAITVGGSDTLLLTTKNSLLAEVNRITALSTTMQTEATTVVTEQTNEATSIANASTSLATIGVALTAGTYLGDAEAARVQAVTLIGSDITPTGTFLSLNNIYALVVDPTAAENRLTEVSTALDEIFVHVDKFLAADCKANLVTVPILARDQGGFYVAPSTALIQSLMTYLDARKEVTQTVEVVSGAAFLILPKITLRVAVRSGFSLAVMEAAVAVAVDNLLRDRRFGVSLYVSDVVDAVTTLTGVAFTNVTIAGHKVEFPSPTISTTKLDSEGNLLIEPSEIITKDTADPSSITINVEAFQNQ